MLINASLAAPAKTNVRPSSLSRTAAELPSLPTDQVTLSGRDGHGFGYKFGFGASAAVASAIPGLGIATNAVAGFGAAWDGSVPAMASRFGAAALNAAGTVSLIGSAVSGNVTALQTGFALLGASALTAGITGFVTSTK